MISACPQTIGDLINHQDKQPRQIIASHLTEAMPPRQPRDSSDEEIKSSRAIPEE